MGTSSHGALSGPGRGCEGWERQGTAPLLWGHWCQLGGGAGPLPISLCAVLRVPAPNPRAWLAAQGLPSLGIPWWPRDRYSGHSLALPELASLPSCLGTHQHHSSCALEQSRSNICTSAGPDWFCSWHCCSSSAEERVGGNFCLATAAAA